MVVPEPIHMPQPPPDLAADARTSPRESGRLQQTAIGEPCLQMVDYMNWSVYRAFVKREMRYYHYVEEKVSLLVDLYDTAKYPHNWYRRDNPFDINKTSPL